MGDRRGSARKQARNLRRVPVFAFAGILAISLLLVVGVQVQAQTTRAKAQIVQPINPARLVTLHGNTPRFARAENDRGPAPDGLILNRMLLVLKRPPEQETSLRKLLVDQQVKSSPNYHHWLTPAQFGEQFGPADADIQTVRAWLSSQGFQIDRVSAGRAVIEFSGTAANVQEAFHTGIHQYVVNGSAYWSNAADPQIPAALAPAVVGIASLNNFPIKAMSHRAVPWVSVKRAEGATPLFTFTSPDGTVYHAVSPADFDTIYNVPSSVGGVPDGSGETIAIVASSNVNLQDSSNFRDAVGLVGTAPNVILNGPDPGIIPGYESEADLDMEWAGAVAPAATIDLVVSQDTLSTPGINLSALYIVDNNLAPVMSMSYGTCGFQLGVAGLTFFNSLWEQAAAEGISAVVAAGDDGSAACDFRDSANGASTGLAVSGVASTPFNVAVGGTDFNDSTDPSSYWRNKNNPAQHSSSISYIPEITWNDSCAQVGGAAPCAPVLGTGKILDLQAGGGGPSTCSAPTVPNPIAICVAGYPKPAWQSGPGVPTDGVRDVPDVSLFSGLGRNGSFYLYCEADLTPNQSTSCNLENNFQFQTVGGTSVAAQAFAGIMALIDQKAGERQGNPNYVLYTLAAQPGASCPSDASAVQNVSCVFYDVVTGNNALPCDVVSENCSAAGPGGFGVLTEPGSNPPIAAWPAGPGYDLATGLGSVNVANLINQWSSVSFAPSATTLSLSPTTLTHGQAASVSIQVSAQGGTPAGTVALLGGPGASETGIASFTLSGGAASSSTSSLPGGTYNVTAHYAGDGTFGASNSSPVQVTVGKENSTTTLRVVTFTGGTVDSTNASSFAYGSPYMLNIEVENSAGSACGATQVPATVCPSGTVNLTDNGAPLDTTVNILNSLGEMQDTLIQLPPGSHSLVASYLGDNSFNPSTSAPDMVTVTQAPTITFLNGGGNVQAESSMSLTANVTTQSNGAAPTGTVQFFNGSTPISGAVSYSTTPDPNTGFAELTATISTAFSASTTISAQYSGDTNYSGSSSAVWPVVVLPDFGVSVTPTSVTIPAEGQTGQAAITVASGGGFTGMITLGCQLPVTLTQAACSFTPAQVSTSGQSTITITTTAPQTGAALFPMRRPPEEWPVGVALLSAALIVLLVLLVLLVGFVAPASCRYFYRTSRGWPTVTPAALRRRYGWGLLFSLVFFIFLVMASCGGGVQGSAPSPPPPNPGTPAGTYTVTVTAASGTSSHEATLTVVVQ